MESKIIHAVREWLPWAINDECKNSEYLLLRKLANYCRDKMQGSNQDDAFQVIKIVNFLYADGSLHIKNAIENEFLEVLATDETPASLKEHIHLLPEKLRTAYLKTILEN